MSVPGATSANNNPAADVLSLFIRAQIIQPSGGEGLATQNAKYSAAMSALLQTMLNIVDLCYDFYSEAAQGGSAVGGASSSEKKALAKKKKRKARDSEEVLEITARQHIYQR